MALVHTAVCNMTPCLPAVVKAGAIIESGSHWELLARPDGAYATLVKLQAISRSRHKEVPQRIGMLQVHTLQAEALQS